MLNNLMDFSHKRNVKEAIVFYIIALIVGLIINIAAGSIIDVIFRTYSAYERFDIGFTVGYIIAITFCLTLSILIVYTKNLYKNFFAIGLVLLTLLLSVAMGFLLGLIPVAVLSTFAKNKS